MKITSKKTLKICLALPILAVAYLLAVNWSIYYRISVANLKASDNQRIYAFNGAGAATSSGSVYVSLGDSLTAGVGVPDYRQSYPYLIAQGIAGTSTRVTHLNYSYPGAKTGDLITNLLAGAIASDPDIVTLLIGVNDIHDKVGADQFRSNYETILTRLQARTTAKINVISIPYIGSDSLLLPPYNLYFRTRTDQFNRIIKELAIAKNINYIDLTAPTKDYASGRNDYYSIDNFHPSDSGYQYWSQIIYEHLDK